MTTPNANANLGVMIDNAPGADGRVWPRVQFLSGPTAFIFAVPPEVFKAFLAQIAEAGAAALEEAETANGSVPAKKLALPSPADVHRLSNGRKDGQYRR